MKKKNQHNTAYSSSFFFDRKYLSYTFTKNNIFLKYRWVTLGTQVMELWEDFVLHHDLETVPINFFVCHLQPFSPSLTYIYIAMPYFHC